MQPNLIQTAWDDREVERAVDDAISSGRTRIKVTRMSGLGSYNGISGELRCIVDRKIKVAVELGLIPAARELGCSVCGNTEGRIDYHNEDYSRPLQTVAICMTCHLSLHSRFRTRGYAASWDKRVKQHGNGTKWFEHIITFRQPADLLNQVTSSSAVQRPSP